MGRQIMVMAVATALLVAVASSVKAQTASKIARVGLLSAGGGTGTAPSIQGFNKRMSELGWIDGQNLTVEFSSAKGKLESLPGLAADLVRRVDLIVALGNAFTLRAAKEAASTIPVVMVAIDYDPVALGYVAGLARPGGNVTGVFLQQPELTPKRLELLKEALPRASRVAVLWDALSADQLKAAEYVDRILRGVKPADLPVEQPTRFELVINMKTARALGLTILPHLLVLADEVIR